MIRFPGEHGDEGKCVPGIAFTWDGELVELREGSLDLEKWLQQKVEKNLI